MPESQQLVLFPDPPPLALREARPPRVWVRRLVLWQDVELAPFRDVVLARGLNIVWSPSGETPEDDRLPSGHAAGKTLFCRAVRHCLGEASFADAKDTTHIRSMFPKGAIGAEIVVDDEVWAVRRPLVGGRDLAVRGGDLHTLTDPESASDFSAYVEALQSTLGDAARVGQYPEPQDCRPWQYALAWLTRDQECRVDGISTWRHKDTGSRSPVRSASADARLTVLRLALNVYDTQARERAERIERVEEEVTRATKGVTKVASERDALVAALAGSLGVDEDDVRPTSLANTLGLDDYKRRIRELTRSRIAALRQPPPTDTSHIDEARLNALEADLAEMQARLESEQAEVNVLRTERALHAEQRPALDRRLSEAKHPTCPWDGAPLDVEASKAACPLVKFEDADAVRADVDALKARAREVSERLAEFEPQLAATAREHRRLTGQRDELERRVRQRHESEAREQAHRDQEMAAAWGATALAERLLDTMERARRAEDAHNRLKADLDTLRGQENETRAAQNVGPITTRFRDLIHRVLGKDASGRVRLDGHGLHAEIDQHSVALNSLKVVLFDLAAMMCAAEGRAFLPAFLLHDSPREGDLDPSTYRRIFRAIHALAPDPSNAPFQYIITTTSPPPEEMKEAFVRLQLASIPASERFYGVDL